MSPSQSLSAEGLQGKPIAQIYLQITSVVNEINQIAIGWDKNSPTDPPNAKDWATNIFKVDKDDKIVGVYVWRKNESDRVEAIQFLTTKLLSQKYGGRPFESPSFYSAIDKGGANALLSMQNMVQKLGDSSYITNLKFHWGRPRVEGYRFLQLGSYVGTELYDHEVSPRRGYFNTLEAAGNHWTTELRELKIWHAERIDAIQCVYTNGKETSKFGGDGGGFSTLKLADGEYITNVEGRASREVDSLTIFTSNGRIERFGGLGGGPFLWDPSTSDDEADLCLLGFFGQTTGFTSTINRLAPMWATAPPNEYTLRVTSPQPTPADLKTEKVIVNSDSTDIKNDSPLSIERVLKVEETVKSSSHYKFSSGTKTTEGWEWQLKLEAGGDIKMVKLKLEGSVKLSVSSETSTVTENGFEHTREMKLSNETKIRCPEYSTMHATVFYTKSTIDNYPWTGILTAHYRNGKTVDYQVGGTFASIACTGLTVDLRATKLDGHHDDPHPVRLHNN